MGIQVTPRRLSLKTISATATATVAVAAATKGLILFVRVRLNDRGSAKQNNI